MLCAQVIAVAEGCRPCPRPFRSGTAHPILWPLAGASGGHPPPVQTQCSYTCHSHKCSTQLQPAPGQRPRTECTTTDTLAASAPQHVALLTCLCCDYCCVDSDSDGAGPHAVAIACMKLHVTRVLSLNQSWGMLLLLYETHTALCLARLTLAGFFCLPLGPSVKLCLEACEHHFAAFSSCRSRATTHKS